VVTRSRITVVVALALMSAAAQAHREGEFIVRAGLAQVDPKESSDSLEVAGAALGGTGVGLDSAAALGLAATYMLTDKVGIEVLAATPFQHTIAAKGLGIDRVGSTKHLPPTISLQYYPLNAGSAIQPYVGVGLNYTTFFQESVSGQAKAALGASNLELDDSTGLAVQVGVDWHLSDRWLLNAAVWRMDIDTTGTLDTALGRVKVDVDVDPWAYMVGVGYKF
jgi:outer membrane protein